MTSPHGLLAFLHWNHPWNHHHFPPSLIRQSIKQLKDLGSPMLRLDIVWSDIHRGLYQYDFSHYDYLISELSQAGFDLLILLHYNKVREGSSGEMLWNHPPDSISEFARYVETTVRRYKSVVHHWEIWNEPNHPVYWAAPPDELRTFCHLLRASYIAAKNADPACVVLNGGLTEPLLKSVEQLYQHGGKDIFDILSIHTFLPPVADSEGHFDQLIKSVRKTMVLHNDAEKKIWITEMGCPGVPPRIHVKDWWIGKNTTEDDQAAWLKKEFAMVQKYPFIEKLFWAFYRDTDGIFQDGVDHFGLVRFDFTPKPAYYELRKLIKNGSVPI
ncbi:MAG: hypothetical protein KCHDKBKB_02632 [Elusimicrobia bacterium]|nr:hypothetical protein [Elusimicrobiota bacterium]